MSWREHLREGVSGALDSALFGRGVIAHVEVDDGTLYRVQISPARGPRRGHEVVRDILRMSDELPAPREDPLSEEIDAEVKKAMHLKEGLEPLW